MLDRESHNFFLNGISRFSIFSLYRLALCSQSESLSRRSAMTIVVRPLHPLFVGEVSGVDLRCPVDREMFLEIEAALARYAVLVFRAQPLEDEQQIAFSRLFGPLETSIGTIRKDRKLRLGSHEIADVSNLDADNNIRVLSDRWRMRSEEHTSELQSR